MSFKSIYKKNLANQKNLDKYRYVASKIMFIFLSYIFFLFFYFSAAGYYDEYLIPLLTPTYLLLLISLTLFTFYYTKQHFSKKLYTYIALAVSSLFSLICSILIIL